MEDVDVGAARRVGEVGRDGDGETFRVRRPRQMIGLHVVETAFLLDDLGPGGHDLGVLAVEADADEVSRLRVHVDDFFGAAQHELEVGETVALLRFGHEELGLVVRFSVQPVAAVEHENLEGGHAELRVDVRHLLDVFFARRHEVEAVVHVIAAAGILHHVLEELEVGTALVEVVVTGAEVGQRGGHPAHGRALGLGRRILGEMTVDADVHVRIDNARKGDQALSVDHVGRQRGVDLGRHPGELPVLECDIGNLEPDPVRPRNFEVFDHSVVHLIVHGLTPGRLHICLKYSTIVPDSSMITGDFSTHHPRSSPCAIDSAHFFWSSHA